MEDYEKLEKKIDALSKRNEWRIAVASAIVAAIASCFAAYMVFVAEDKKIDSTQHIEKEKNSIEVYKAFGDHIITGKNEERCLALMLISTAHPYAGMKFKNQKLSNYLKCESQEKFYEFLAKSAGTTCGRTRVTNTTLRNLSEKEDDEAREMCITGIKIPDTFDGPWDDGTVSFYYGKTSNYNEVWCNCIQSKE